MGLLLSLFLFLFVFDNFTCKDLHRKEESSFKEILVVGSNPLNNNNAYVENERFARHVELSGTEASDVSLNHFMAELRQRYPKTKKTASLQLLLKDLKHRLRKYVRTKRPLRPKAQKQTKNDESKQPMENIWKKVTNPGKIKKKYPISKHVIKAP